MGKIGRPLKDNKRDDSYRLRLNTEERQMLTHETLFLVIARGHAKITFSFMKGVVLL